MPRRLVQLFAGLVLYGVSSSMLLLAGLGVDPWDVLHQGLARRTGIPTGTWAIIAGVAVLLLWIPLRQRPGLGTLCNVVVVGTVIDLVLATVTPPRTLPVQAVLMVSGVVLNGVATGLYIGAGLGPGPRDGLMTGFAARGHSLRVVRTCIEATVLLAAGCSAAPSGSAPSSTRPASGRWPTSSCPCSAARPSRKRHRPLRRDSASGARAQRGHAVPGQVVVSFLAAGHRHDQRQDGA